MKEFKYYYRVTQTELTLLTIACLCTVLSLIDNNSWIAQVIFTLLSVILLTAEAVIRRKRIKKEKGL